ncbi:MAG: hypothetical protein VCC00_10220 [Deltaproteobacteria bacterium]
MIGAVRPLEQSLDIVIDRQGRSHIEMLSCMHLDANEICRNALLAQHSKGFRGYGTEGQPWRAARL